MDIKHWFKSSQNRWSILYSNLGLQYCIYNMNNIYEAYTIIISKSWVAAAIEELENV